MGCTVGGRLAGMGLAAGLLAAGCGIFGGDDDDDGNDKGDKPTTEACVGAEGCKCYPNSTCDQGLTCASMLCVRLGSSAGGDGDPGSAGRNSAGGGGQAGASNGAAGASGKPAPPAPAADCDADGSATPSGSLRTDVAEIVFDRVTVEVHHKRDVDVSEDGCIRQLLFHFQAGEGCKFDLEAAEELDVDGRLKILSAQLSADSQCPMFPDASEGTYQAVTPLRFGGVRMEYATIGVYNVAEACIENTFWVEPLGDMTEISTGRKLSALSGTQLSVRGNFLATAADGRCPPRDEPPMMPPPAGSGGSGGSAGSSGSGGASGSGGSGGSGPPADYSCVQSKVISTTTNDSCTCSPCTTTGCGQGTCAGFSDCCGTWSTGECQCVDGSALGLTCPQIVSLLMGAGAGSVLTQVASCP